MQMFAPTPEDERVAGMLHALGNPMRLAIVRYIAENPGCICNDLVLRFDRAQATMSQHLATLRRARVLVAEQDGHSTCYHVDEEHVRWLQQHLGTLQTMNDER